MSRAPHPFDPTPLQRWLIEAGLASLPAGELFDGFCRRLVAAGLPIARGFLSIGALHPQWRSKSFTWQAGRIAEVADFAYGYMQTSGWQASPFRHMMETRTPRLHRHLVGADALATSPNLELVLTWKGLPPIERKERTPAAMVG